jgi:Protein of unknown function (DUF1176)
MKRIALIVSVVAGMAWPALAQTPAPPVAQPDVDLKLFEKAEVDRTKGCSVALWQANRNPDTDRFAFIFQEALAPRTFAREPARIKIGGQVLTMTRIATGGKASGFGLHEYQLYRLPGANDYVVFNLKLGETKGDIVEVESGSMQIIMQGRQIFPANVKGNARCATPAPQAAVVATPPVPQVTPGAKTYEIPEKQVPKALLAEARRRYECNDEVMAQPATALNISADKAVWEIPCDRFAYQASSVFALVTIRDPAKDPVLLTFPAPPGKKRSTTAGVLLNAEWDADKREISSTSVGRSMGDCGTLEVHRITDAGRFELREYREKPRCDGKVIDANKWPLVFKAK